MSSITDLLSPPKDISAQSGSLGCFVLGTVSENNNKDFPAMVKAEFTAWEEGKNISKWLPVLFSYAGKEHGKYIIPEIGDIVLIGFMGAMLEKPFILGSFYPAGATLPGEQFTDKNTNRHIKTKGGVMLTVKDEDSKQSVDIETPKGLKLSLSDENEVITVTDKNEKNNVILDCKGGNITVNGDKKIAFKTGNCEITMDGVSGALEIKCDRLKIEAAQTAEIKSSNSMNVKGTTLNVESQQLTLKGNAMCEISGGMVKIN